MATFQFYTDAGLTTPKVGPLAVSEAFDGSTGPIDTVLYYGSTNAARSLRNAASPGTGQVTVSIVDAATGSGQPAGIIKLASTQGGLAAATAGAPLNLGTVINGGSAGAKQVWVRIDITLAGGNLALGTYTDLSLVTNSVVET